MSYSIQINQLENDYDIMNEPPRKKMKHEPKLIQFDVGYLIPSSNILILKKTSEPYKYNENYKPILHFQSVEGADVYIIANMVENTIDINKGYTLDEIYNYFINGKFHIGSVQHYVGNYKINNIIIRNINILDHDDNSEIKIHYTTSIKTQNPLNVAWRTIHWDLFSEYVPQSIL